MAAYSRASRDSSIPSLGLTFYGGTPADTIYPTNIYTLEYDGFADFPQYPLNFVSDLNAVAGILFVHTTYVGPFLGMPAVTQTQVDSAIHLSTSPGNYTMWCRELLHHSHSIRPYRIAAVHTHIAYPIADLLQPDLRVLVNLGYGNPDYGWSTGYANVTTPFGFAPHVGVSIVLSVWPSGPTRESRPSTPIWRTPRRRSSCRRQHRRPRLPRRPSISRTRSPRLCRPITPSSFRRQTPRSVS